MCDKCFTNDCGILINCPMNTSSLKSDDSIDIPNATLKKSSSLQLSHPDLFTTVTDNIKCSPVPESHSRASTTSILSLIRSKSLPSSKLVEDEMYFGLSSSQCDGFYPGDVFSPATSKLSEFQALPFLGEHLSSYETNYNTSINDGRGFLRKGMSRSLSLEGLGSVAVSRTPSMIRMPPITSYLEIGDSLENIPLYGWFMPYIVACAPPQLLRRLSLLPPLSGVRRDCQEGSPELHSCPHSTTTPKKKLNAFGRAGLDLCSHPIPTTATTADIDARSASQSVHCTKHKRSNSVTSRDNRSSSAGICDDNHIQGPSSSSGCFSPTRSSFPSTWRSLGVVWVIKDPSWRPWEAKQVFLLDNFLFEATADGNTFIGYAPLSGATIARQTLRKSLYEQPVSVINQTTLRHCSRPSGELSSSFRTRSPAHSMLIHQQQGSSDSPEGEYVAERSDSPLLAYSENGSHMLKAMSIAAATTSRTGVPPLSQSACTASAAPAASTTVLAITCFTTSQTSVCPTATFYLAVPPSRSQISLDDVSELDAIETALTAARALTVHDVYNFNVREQHDDDQKITETTGQQSEEAGVLGRGRFTEVRLACRRQTAIATATLSPAPSSATQVQLLHQQVDRNASDRQFEPEYEQKCEEKSITVGSVVHVVSRGDSENESNCGEDLFEDRSSVGSSDGSVDSEEETDNFNIESHLLNTSTESAKSATSAAMRLQSPVFSTHCETATCAVKLISKELFWERVVSAQERGDSLVREVLAQTLTSRFHSIVENNNHGGYMNRQPHFARHTRLGLQPPLAASHNSLPIVEIRHVLETADGFAMELELMHRGDLFDKLAAEGPMDEIQVSFIAAQLVDAISICNHVGIAHRDVKLSNVTFPARHSEMAVHHCLRSTSHNSEEDNKRDSNNNKSGSTCSERDMHKLLTVKLADFGMAGFLGADMTLRGRCGTPGYVAPDILNAGKNEGYGLNIDMFSIGVAVYTLLAGYEPFYGSDTAELMQSNREVRYAFHSPEWDDVHGDTKDFIAQCLCPAAEQRITPEQAKRHPFIRTSYKAVEVALLKESTERNHSEQHPCATCNTENIKTEAGCVVC